MSILSYFIVKKSDVLEGELEKVVPASMAESVRTELQRTGVKQEKAAQLRRCYCSGRKARRLCRAESCQCFTKLLLFVLVRSTYKNDVDSQHHSDEPHGTISTDI